MPKYLLLKHYRGGPDPYRPVPPMDQWAPEDVDAHMKFLHEVAELLRERGEYVDAQALTPVQTWVRYGGPGADPVITDGPHPETGDLVAGWYMHLKTDRPIFRRFFVMGIIAAILLYTIVLSTLYIFD